MTTHEFALSDLAARLLGTDASLSTSLRDILTVVLQELIEAELTAAAGSMTTRAQYLQTVDRVVTELYEGVDGSPQFVHTHGQPWRLLPGYRVSGSKPAARMVASASTGSTTRLEQ